MSKAETAYLANATKNYLPKPGEAIEQTLLRFIDNTAGHAREQFKGELIYRTNVVRLIFNENGQLQDLDTGEVLDTGTRNETATDKLENIALEKIKKKLKKMKSGVLLWTSPPEVGFYEEARINSYEVAYQGGQKVIHLRAFPAPISAEECLQTAQAMQRINKVGKKVTSINELRTTPVEIPTWEGVHWTKIAAKYFPQLPNQIWEDVRKGRDLTAKQNAREVVRKKIAAEVFPELLLASTDLQHFLLGIKIEYLLEQAGFALQSSKHCGLLHRDLLSPFSKHYEAASGKYEYEPGQCRVCKTEALVGPCKVCVSCEKKFDNGELPLAA